VKFLEVELTGDTESVSDFFYALAGRTPNLKEFILRTSTTAMNIERSLQKAVNTWKNLETLVIPPYYLRPDIMGAVASLPNLKHLEHDYKHQSTYDEVAMLQELPENAFPKLQTFEFNSNPAASQRLILKHPGLFSKLIKILIDSAESVNEEEVLKLVDQVGTPATGDPPTFISAHPYPLTINGIQVKRMAAAWPELEIFNLCTEPDLSLIRGDMGNSLSILRAFAKHFPMVETLGLYFAKNQVFTFSGDLYPEFEFRKLEKLDVGVSAVPRERLQEVGFLIASLCKQMPKIEVGVSGWYAETDHPDWATYRSQWMKVKGILKFAMRTKAASRATTSRAVT
ncbi:hypothetical protein FS837_003706, partial [Tulasnella sp. UAMH 9824]